MKKRLLFLGTGGIFCCEEVHNIMKATELNKGNLLSFIPELGMDYTIDVLNVFNTDASDILPKNWLELTKVIKKNIHNYDGIVILHGIDTLHYTASALSFLIIDPIIPIVVTGYQLSPNLKNSDVKRNIIDASKVAAECDLHEVVVVFDGDIMRGNRVRKRSDKSTAAFVSTIPLLGTVNDAGIKLDSKRALKLHKEGMRFFDNIDKNVAFLKMMPGLDADIVLKFGQLGYKALVIETFSSGNLPINDTVFIETLKNAIEYGMFIVLCSQSLEGYVDYDDDTLIGMGSYSKFKAFQVGAVPARDMTSEAALTKVMWLLGNFENDLKSMKELFLTNVSGEITEK